MSALYSNPVTITRTDFISIGRRLQDIELYYDVQVSVTPNYQSIVLFNELACDHCSFTRYEYNSTIAIEYGKAWSDLLLELEEYEQQYNEAAEAYNTELAF